MGKNYLLASADNLRAVVSLHLPLCACNFAKVIVRWSLCSCNFPQAILRVPLGTGPSARASLRWTLCVDHVSPTPEQSKSLLLVCQWRKLLCVYKQAILVAGERSAALVIR